MKKTFWIILGAALLTGIILFVCLRQEASDLPADPSLPSLMPEQGTAQNVNPNNPAENGASGEVGPNGVPPETGDQGSSGPAETEPAIPIDWNQKPSESKQNTEERPRTSETPTVPGAQTDPPEKTEPSQTEPGEETREPEESSGQIVIPILPPDIFP